MKFFSHLPQKNTYTILSHFKEMVIAVILIIFTLFYPNTAEAGIFSFISDMAGDKAMAKALEVEDVPNSQNMTVLKAVVNSNPNPNAYDSHQILAKGNALVAEIGPAGVGADLDHDFNTEISLYVVRSGDTLSRIADMFDVTVNTIIWANNISKNAPLKEGQMLVILPITGIQHIVKKGDTIKGIVSKYKADLNEVLQYNGLTLGSSIIEGSTILIPDAEPTVVQKTSVASTRLPSLTGYFIRPILGGRKSQGIHGHNGVDLAAPVGTSIFAAAGGTVIASKSNGAWNGGYGNYIIISHPNGTQTLYSHNQVNFVSVGDKVAKGDLIAKIGMTGKTTGPHVHFEIRGATNPF